MKLALPFAIFSLTALAAETEPRKKLPNGRSDLAAGKKLFEHHCGLCHGPRGEGGRGPVLAKARLSRAPDDGALVKVLENGIRGTEMPGVNAMSEQEIRQTAAYVRSLGKVKIEPVPGNAAHGAEIYRGKGGCANCHAMNGDGGIAGPDLAGIGGRRSAAYLKESLLTPESALPDDYMLVTVSPKSGAIVTGSRANEDSFSIQVLDAAGSVHSFWKSDIAELKKQRGKSPMPSYKGTLSEEELIDLVAYLASLKEEK
ncbi:MAG: c-type cytochrome [Bryobacteraceae bacterium]